MPKKPINEKVALSGGLGYRGYLENSDAVIGLLGIDFSSFEVGLSYDWNISSLSDVGQKTTVEISIVAKTPKSRNRKLQYKKTKICPVDVDTT